MNLKKLHGILAVLLLSLFVFTACEETEDGPLNPSTSNYPTAVTGLAAGCADENTIIFAWDEHNQNAESWFKDFLITIRAEGSIDSTTVVLAKTATEYKFENAVEGTIYNFSIVGRNDDNEYRTSSIATIQWATASQFKKNDNNADIKVYGSSSDFGSGLQLYNEDGEAPKVWKIASQANWNLGLSTKNNQVKFGSASALGYSNLTTCADAEITSLFNVDVDKLGDVVFEEKPATFTYSKKTIDLLNDPIAVKATKGVMFFVRTLDKKHYAKILILKKNGSFLQGSGDDQYVQVYVSYQKVENVPFAKH